LGHSEPGEGKGEKGVNFWLLLGPGLRKGIEGRENPATREKKKGRGK